MGRHDHDAGPVTEDWEQPPPVAPLWRIRIVTSAVLLLAVIAGTWWMVSWLTSPAGPAGAGVPAAASLAEPEAPGEQTGTPEQSGALEQDQPGAESAGQGRPGVAASASSPATGIPGTVVVHVAGEVQKPGLVELPAGARVADALQAAGGSTSQAELDLLNLAAPVADASQILVPGPDTATAAPGAMAAVSGTVSGGTSGTTPEAAGAAGTADGTVNLNTADAAALEQLPGIGPALAGRIITHREQVGPYGSMADLDAVSGIGPAMMEQLDGLVSW